MFKNKKFYFLIFFAIIIIFLIITQTAKPKYYNSESITYIRKFIPEIIKKPIRSVLYNNVVAYYLYTFFFPDHCIVTTYVMNNIM